MRPFDPRQGLGALPVTLHVFGAELTTDQMAGVTHAYLTFKQQVATSPAPGLFENRTLPDGTRLRMESTQGADKVLVWPPEGTTIPRTLRGFVLRALWANPAHVDADTNTPILLDYTPTAGWGAKIVGYAPGEADAIGYRVLSTATEDIVDGVIVEADDKYHDTLSLWDNTLHMNAVGTQDAQGASDQELPLRLGGTRLLLVAQSTVRGWDADNVLQILYNFVAFFAPISPGWVFQAGPRVAADDSHVQFLGYNKTTAGALQKWRAKVPLSTAGVGAVATENDQMGAEPTMFTSGGWDYSVTTPIADTPRFGGVSNPDSMAIYAHYVGPPSAKVYTGPLYGTTYSAIPRPTSTRPTLGTQYHDFTGGGALTTSESLTLYDGITATVTRTVDMLTRYSDMSVQVFYGTTPLDLIVEGTPSAGPKNVELPLNNPAGGIVTFLTNEPVPVEVYRERGEERVHTGTSTSEITVTGLPKQLHTASIVRSDSGKDGFRTDKTYSATLGAGPINLGGDSQWDTYGTIQVTTGTFTRWRTDDRAAAATLVSRDYLFCDTVNQVYVWVECTIESYENQTRPNGGTLSTTGSATITVTLHLRSPMLTTSVVLEQFLETSAVSLALITPPDINMGTSDLGWQYVQPLRLEPVFAPLWQEQGLCPHIAYTTAEETDLAQQIILLSLRLQLVKTEREVTDTDPPTLTGAVAFAPYMMEQMLRGYGKLSTKFLAWEATPFRIDLNFPVGDVRTGAGVPGLHDTVHSHFYRT